MRRRHDDLPWDESDAIYHYIGVYIVEFSSIVSLMRHFVSSFISPDAEYGGNPMLDSVFDKMTADPIRTSFFALCREYAHLEDEDERIRATLNAHVQRMTERRNEIAHADWHVGWVIADTDEVVPPTATKIHVAKDGIRREEVFNANKLINLIVEIDILRKSLRHFGFTCLKRHSGDLSVQPSDILEISKHQRFGKIVVHGEEQWLKAKLEIAEQKLRDAEQRLREAIELPASDPAETAPGMADTPNPEQDTPSDPS
ncbi:hypothetical protein KGQ20_36415 [Catenulispora sp. NF23]|uniref:hypothetical protein n=1 Tax=Catenulispora pinistramenti TaxID=2705254 RepID=UPI001BA520C3|nr:hypothetical protein [Catenulispora pinistramenti]MBS2538250.1 hypothetical protein [Catenulispora pinistramenti]